MQSERYLLFRSGSESCAVTLSCVREIARHSVLAPAGDSEPGNRGRVNARGAIARVMIPGDAEIENPAICIVVEENQQLTAIVADEIFGVECERGDARLLIGAPAQSAA